MVQVPIAMQIFLPFKNLHFVQYFIRRKNIKNASDRLFILLNNDARNPEYFGAGKIEDSPDGRFEAMALFAAAYLSALGTKGALEKSIAQELQSRIFKTFDQGLRELGVGDMAVGKRIRKLAESFYGRVISYKECFLQSDLSKLTSKIALNVFGRSEINDFDVVLARQSMDTFARICGDY